MSKRDNFAVRAPSALELKLAQAKAYLGSKWILHPQYSFDPRHSTDRDTWRNSHGKRSLERVLYELGADARVRNTALF
jgi:hypothetical protein